MIPAAAAALVGRVPVWAWALVVALAWGAWQRHEARVAADKLASQAIAAERQKAADTADALRQQQRISTRQGEAANAAQSEAEAARAAADRARAAAGELQRRLAAAQRSARPAPAAASVGGAAAGASGDLCPELLGRAVSRAVELADFADRASIAGQACQRAYDALTEPTVAR